MIGKYEKCLPDENYTIHGNFCYAVGHTSQTATRPQNKYPDIIVDITINNYNTPHVLAHT